MKKEYPYLRDSKPKKNPTQIRHFLNDQVTVAGEKASLKPITK